MSRRILSRFDHRKLAGRITEVYGGHVSELAYRIGIAPTGLKNKLKGNGDFKASEIARICEELDIPFAEIQQYFFKEEADS